MDLKRREFLSSLWEHGSGYDRQESDRVRRYRNITQDTGEFLSLLVQALPARRILEVGTSNGYSTIWLADALPAEGLVTTIESDSGRAHEALRNFDRAGLQEAIQLREARAQDVLPILDGPFDLVFLDAERHEYVQLWPKLSQLLNSNRGLLVVDNAVSHATELEEFFSILEGDPRFVTSLVPVGKGEYLALARTERPVE